MNICIPMPSWRKEDAAAPNQMEWPLVKEGATPTSAETMPRPDLGRD
jgi:hypothetical protein